MSDGGDSSRGDGQRDLLRTSIDGAVATLCLTRPEKRNALDVATVEALYKAVSHFIEDSTVRSIVITGSGPAFSAGGDLEGYRRLYRQPDDFRRFVSLLTRLCDLLEYSHVVTVAMVNGDCVAGGLELALSCDFIVMADGARIGDGHLRFGQVPACSVQRLVRAIGIQRARHWLYTGRLFSAAEAVDAGLALAAVPSATLAERTREIVDAVLEHSPLGVRVLKEMVGYSWSMTADEAKRREVEANEDYALNSHDAFEGLVAFSERRTPRYEGR